MCYIVLCIYIYIEREREIHICICICMYYIYIYIYIYMRGRRPRPPLLWWQASRPICMYVYVYIYIYIYIYQHAGPSLSSWSGVQWLGVMPRLVSKGLPSRSTRNMRCRPSFQAGSGQIGSSQKCQNHNFKGWSYHVHKKEVTAEPRRPRGRSSRCVSLSLSLYIYIVYIYIYITIYVHTYIHVYIHIYIYIYYTYTYIYIYTYLASRSIVEVSGRYERPAVRWPSRSSADCGTPGPPTSTYLPCSRLCRSLTWREAHETNEAALDK